MAWRTMSSHTHTRVDVAVEIQAAWHWLGNEAMVLGGWPSENRMQAAAGDPGSRASLSMVDAHREVVLSQQKENEAELKS